jgi:hypothetical protein
VARTSARRPLPAVAFLVGLSLLTALVWWRVIHRADADTKPKSSSTATCTPVPANVLPQPIAVTVNVLNSTQRVNLAHTASTTLANIGFKIDTVADDKSGLIAGVGDIRYGPSGKTAAQLLSYYLPSAKLVPNKSTSSAVVISLGTKFVKFNSTAKVRLELKAKHVSQAAAAPSATGTAAPC